MNVNSNTKIKFRRTANTLKMIRPRLDGEILFVIDKKTFRNASITAMFLSQ